MPVDGDLTGWTFTPAQYGSDFYVWGCGGAYSGSYAACFGGVSTGYYDTISQVIPTVAGQSYTFSFYLDGMYGYDNGQMALWDGVPVMDLTNFTQGWVQYSYSEVATSSSTTIAFAGYNVPSWNGLDDVDVVPGATPEPATWVLGLGAILGVITLRKRR